MLFSSPRSRWAIDANIAARQTKLATGRADKAHGQTITKAVNTQLFLTGLILLGAALTVRAEITLAQDGRSAVVILQQPGATAAEINAARELATTLHEITGGDFEVAMAGAALPPQAIIVGPGAAAKQVFGDLPWDRLGSEEIVVQTKGGHLLLAGGRPRGTLYAVSHFLQRECGVRWWTPWASRIPRRPTLKVGETALRHRPTFELRDPFWFPAFEARWAVRNFSNSQSAKIPEEWGGCIRYQGFVHTFFPLVPPKEHFATHPEWFSEIKGQRTHERAQLCLTNPELRDFVVGRVRQRLREMPTASIISVSQNDWYGFCECARCQALDAAEDSHAGTLLDFVNHVAAGIEAEFPHVAVDTLAYQYTRQPPRTIRPRPNVIVRLCSIECNFREPLAAPVNAKFAEDIAGWEKICDRLYIWDYTTNFAHYLQPHPNWFTLGANVRFFAAHRVKGLFEQGAYQGFGAEFAELRAWVLAQLLWDPALDDRQLIAEFLDGYYGAAAGPIRRYLEHLHGASAGWKLTCTSKTDTPFLRFQPLRAAEALWREAEAAVAGQPDLLRRVQRGRVWLGYVWLSRWDQLRQQCQEAGETWPLADSRAAFAAEWLRRAQGDPAESWTKVAMLNEGRLTPEKFVERFVK